MALIKTMKWFVIVCSGALLFAACGELDPVSVQSLCVGPGPFDEQCPQCQSVPFASECPQCQQSGVDEATCMPPGTGESMIGQVGSVDGGVSGAPNDGQPSSNPDGTTPDSGPNKPNNGPRGGEMAAGGSGGQTPPPRPGAAGSDGPGQPFDPDPPTSRACVTDGDCSDAAYPACRPDGSCTECMRDEHCPGRQCDMPTNRCVECLSDPFCEPQGMVCNRDARACVQCRDDGQCGGGTPACSLTQECVTCINDNHCPSETPACDQMTCYECRFDQQCNSAGKHACIEEEHKCVECETEAQCKSEAGRPHCYAQGNECVQCLADSDCSDRSASHCDTDSHTCVPCSSHAQCAEFAGSAPRCAAGTCVACDEDGGICNGKACILSQNVCSTKDRQSVQACGECITSDECIAGHVCANMKYSNGYDTGDFCLPNLPDFKQCPRPFARKIPNAPTLDGFKVQTLCALPETTTCQAMLDTVAKKGCNGNSTLCGLSASVLGTNDGICPNTVCTYNCTSPEFCPNSMICSEETAVCL